MAILVVVLHSAKQAEKVVPAHQGLGGSQECLRVQKLQDCDGWSSIWHKPYSYCLYWSVEQMVPLLESRFHLRRNWREWTWAENWLPEPWSETERADWQHRLFVFFEGPEKKPAQIKAYIFCFSVPWIFSRHDHQMPNKQNENSTLKQTKSVT